MGDPGGIRVDLGGSCSGGLSISLGLRYFRGGSSRTKFPFCNIESVQEWGQEQGPGSVLWTFASALAGAGSRILQPRGFQR